MKLIDITAAAAAMLTGTPALAQDAAAPGAAPAAAPDYSQEANWLCLPGRADACSQPLPTVALNPNGYGSNGQARPTRDAKVDCFYVYPTVSHDKGLNSDLQAGQEEKGVALFQIARFGSVCRTFAPVYRQATLAALLSGLAGGGRSAEAMATAYADVASAWRHYLQHYNQGRPFVLVGHSQGTIHLTQLLAREIENAPEAARMLSAVLIGFNIEVPEGQKVGGTFQKTPLCSRVGETGCVVTYVSYRATNPPPQAAMFGRASRPGMTVACTNPARLSRGTAPLDSYWPTGVGLSGAPDKIQWSTTGAPPAFFVRTEGLVSAACVNRGNAGYLSVVVNADPSDARTDEIPGDVAIGGRVMPGWGLHLADVSLAQGDLIALVEAQAEAFAKR
jgi:pimeloyl-ACP methyl ester carboxylesterase